MVFMKNRFFWEFLCFFKELDTFLILIVFDFQQPESILGITILRIYFFCFFEVNRSPLNVSFDIKYS